MTRIAFFCIASLSLLSPQVYADKAPFTNPRPVAIENLPPGYGGTPISTEEPFVSRDGRFLFFNTHKLENNKDLHFAEWIGGRWFYRGAIGPRINTVKEVEGNPTMDAHYNFYYIDTKTSHMARGARFDPRTGRLGALREIMGIPDREVKIFRYFKGNMGVEVSADGEYLYFSRATWKMNGFKLGMFLDSDILFSQRHGGRYVYNEAQARRIMRNVNTSDMEYAASISADGLELFFTRLPLADLKRGVLHSWIMRATRNNLSEPFGRPQIIAAIGGNDFVEGPSIDPTGTQLYYHKKVGEKFRLYKVSRAQKLPWRHHPQR